jgi:GT2 family glycosyltransferase
MNTTMTGITSRPEITVVIVTKDRVSSIENCLKAVSRSNLHYREVIVVDSSSPHNRVMTHKIAEKYGARYIFEPQYGIALARNRAIEAATGDFIVSVDDDFEVLPDTLSKLLRNMTDPSVGCCTGKLLYREEKDEHVDRFLGYKGRDRKRVFSWSSVSIRSLLRTIVHMKDMRFADRTPVPWGIGSGLYCLKKEPVIQVGGFDPALGGKPGDYFIGLGVEEGDLYYRLLRSNYKIIYDPQAVAYHSPHHTFQEFLDEDAYVSGASYKVLTTKYLRKDPYMFTLFFMSFLYLVSMSIITRLVRDIEANKVFKMEIVGFITSASYREIKRRRREQ